MFTIEQIKAAHSKVKSGADFPAYFRDLKQLGVTYYETSVKDGHTEYHGNENYTTSSLPGYSELTVVEECDPAQFKSDLLAHQQGKTDYMTFCKDCARSGVEKWTVSMQKMTCIYYDRSGNEILTEAVPE